MNVTVPVHDSARLATFLRERDMPGQRSKTAIERIRRTRRANRPADPYGQAGQVSLAERVRAQVLAAAVAEITRRGGETEIYKEQGKVSARLAIADRDPRTGMTLLAASGWRYYSRRFGYRRASLAYLYGVDDAGPWAVRVPGTMETVAESLAWLEPASVTEARAAGRRVRRQGDVYAIETTRAHDGAGAEDLPASHEWRPGTRYLIHQPDDGRKHRPLKLPYPVRFVSQRALEMGRGGGRDAAD